MLNIKNQTKTYIQDKINKYFLYSLKKLSKELNKDITNLPYSIRILLENQLRNINNNEIKKEDIYNILEWKPNATLRPEIPYMPARVIMQDFTGIPVILDLIMMRKMLKKLGGNIDKINPVINTSIIIDHSLQVDFYKTKNSLTKNISKEFLRNNERYNLIKWVQKSFDNFTVIPPSKGIIHQINLEYLAKSALLKNINNENIIYPDTLIGTDSHTTMINSIGVLGWGVGGIEAESVILGKPYYIPLPDVIGVKLTGKLKNNVFATDLVFKITEILRKYNVVNKFIEYYGNGLNNLSLQDRATISNMAPEYGATIGFFPFDQLTLNFFNNTNRHKLTTASYKMHKEQLLFRDDYNEKLQYSDIIEIDLSKIESSLAGPKRPQDIANFYNINKYFSQSLIKSKKEHGFNLSNNYLQKTVKIEKLNEIITHGSIVIAAITSCTNTSNPSLMIGAGLLAKKANLKGLKIKSYVKTSIAPGSQVVMQYLKEANLLIELENLGFHIVGYGCTTCIGNSGPIDTSLIDAIKKNNLIVASITSGNRNFEGRIHPLVKANYLASPIHVVALAIAGNINFNPIKDIIGKDKNGKNIYLLDIWPTKKEIYDIQNNIINSNMFKDTYKTIFNGTKQWQALKIKKNKIYKFNKLSTYIKCPNFFSKFIFKKNNVDIIGARTLLMLGDFITTDHISPAGIIPEHYPAGQYLKSHGVEKKDFNSYGSRRGNHEVMVRGTFANINIRNLLLDNIEGGYTKYHIDGSQQYIFDAAMKYKKKGIPLIVLAGKEYGTGSSRDWAAKGTFLLGIKAIIAESYERIHRSNLIGMGILPLEYIKNTNAKTIKLNGSEIFNIKNLNNIKKRQILEIEAINYKKNSIKKFKVLARLDYEIEVNYFKNGGIFKTIMNDITNNNK